MDTVKSDNGQFLNVDLLIEGDLTLEPLFRYLSEHLFCFLLKYEGQSLRGRFETNNPDVLEPSIVINEYATIVDGLSPHLRLMWKLLKSRVFQIGIRAGMTCEVDVNIDSKDMADMSRLDCIVKITVFAPTVPPVPTE